MAVIGRILDEHTPCYPVGRHRQHRTIIISGAHVHVSEITMLLPEMIDGIDRRRNDATRAATVNDGGTAPGERSRGNHR